MTFINFVKLSIICVKTVRSIRTKEFLMTRKNYKHKTKNLPTNPGYCMIAPDQKDVFKDSDTSTANSNRS